MPTPKSKRIIVLSSSYSPSNIIANLNLTMNATFVTPSNVTTVNVAEEASSSSSESSEASSEAPSESSEAPAESSEPE